jgi:tRNA 2-thiouridine synthesizing protein A
MIIAADMRIDCVGLLCPVPILKSREALERLAPGQVLEVVADDPGAEADMVAFTAHRGHDLLEIDRRGPIVRFLVRKR